MRRIKGFTLLELVVATALLFLLGSAVSALLIRGLTVWRRAESHLTQLFVVERQMHLLGQTLRNGIALSETPFLGSKEEMSFLTAQDSTRLEKVRYALSPQGESKDLILQWGSYPEEEGRFQTKKLLSGVKSLSLKYGTRRQEGGQTVFQWGEVWGAPATQPTDFPQLVRVEIEGIDSQEKGYALSREFFIPHGVLGESAA